MGSHQPPSERFVDYIVDKGALSGARYPRDAGEGSERYLNSYVLKVIMSCPDDRQPLIRGLSPLGWYGYLKLASQVFGRKRVGTLQDLAGRSGEDDLPSLLSGAGAEVERCVRLHADAAGAAAAHRAAGLFLGFLVAVAEVGEAQGLALVVAGAVGGRQLAGGNPLLPARLQALAHRGAGEVLAPGQAIVVVAAVGAAAALAFLAGAGEVGAVRAGAAAGAAYGAGAVAETHLAAVLVAGALAAPVGLQALSVAVADLVAGAVAVVVAGLPGEVAAALQAHLAAVGARAALGGAEAELVIDAAAEAPRAAVEVARALPVAESFQVNRLALGGRAGRRQDGQRRQPG